jgi:shikimate kinase
MRNRPLLNNVDSTDKLTQLMAERAQLYSEIADLTVATDGRRIQSVAEEIHRALGLEVPDI